MSASPEIDLHRPLAFYDERLKPEAERRPIHVVGRTQNGDILVESQYLQPEGKWWDAPVRYKPNGYAVGQGGRICNVPRQESGFFALDKHGTPYGRGLTILSGIWTEHSGTAFAVEIKREDGVPVAAVLHARP